MTYILNNDTLVNQNRVLEGTILKHKRGVSMQIES